MGEMKWIKLSTGLFDDEKITIIETLPNADSIIVIWMKLLVLAGKSNNDGVLLLNEKIPYTPKKLAAIFHRKEKIVEQSLKIFEEFGMISITEGVISITNWCKHQNIDKLTEIREQTRQRVAKHRNKNVTECNATCNVTVTQCNAIEEEKEEDKEYKEKEIKESVGENASTSTATAITNASEVVSLYNSICVSLAPVKKVTSSRVDAVNEILQKSSIEELEELFRKAEDTPLLKGENKMRWKANFDWLIVEQNAAKVLEGRYTDSDTVTVDSSGTAATYDLEEFFKAAVSSERRKEEVG